MYLLHVLIVSIHIVQYSIKNIITCLSTVYLSCNTVLVVVDSAPISLSGSRRKGIICPLYTLHCLHKSF